ncbi:MAG TPA: class II aldolase/adducin family protein [Stellaceae bacterium]|nr:class II aldolase/adducin family protein [Stellaceae bacterium]
MSQVIFRTVPAPERQGDRDVRVNLAACYRLIAHYGMDDLVFTHISARVPGRPDQFFLNPYGLMFHEITASSLVKVDMEARPVEPTSYQVNRAGFVIHSAILGARPDINCVVHTHTRSGIAVSCLGEGLLSLNQISAAFHNRLAYHDYEGVADDFDEQKRLVHDLDTKNSMILRNHGLLTAGRTVEEAFSLMYYLEQSCRIQMDTMASGGTVKILSDEVAEHTARQFESYGPRGGREWPALVRLLDSRDPSFRQ